MTHAATDSDVPWYDFPPDKTPDHAEGPLTCPTGRLLDGTDAGVTWDNSGNRLAGKTIAVTFDLGQMKPVTRLRALSVTPPFQNVCEIIFLVSKDARDWKGVGLKTGFPTPLTVGGRTRHREFVLEMAPTAAPYVRLEVVPTGHAHVPLNEVTIRAESQQAMEARRRAGSVMHGFFRADVLPPEHWDGYWGEKWRQGDASVPSKGGPGGCVQVYLHNPTKTPRRVHRVWLSAGEDTEVHLTYARTRCGPCGCPLGPGVPVKPCHRTG